MRLAVPGALPALTKTGPLVTSSRALAGVAYQQFARLHLDAAEQSWERPEIYTLDAWLTSVWQQARYSSAELPTLLSPAQEHFVWQQIIAGKRPEVFDNGSLARLATKAADTVLEYAIPLEHEAWNEQRDAEEFHEWFDAFSRRCSAEGWMARREILRRLKPGNKPAFIGFDKAPAPGRMILADTATRAPRIALKQVEAVRDEIELAARWARARFEATPNASVAVFVPGLRTQRALVERVFQSVFYPGRAVLLASEPPESVFHINAPKPLLECPLVASALLLLELAYPQISQANATAIIRSSFITGGSEERGLRAAADLKLRSWRELVVTLHQIERASSDCPRLQHVWKRVRTLNARTGDNNDFPRWARFFADLLSAAGWPGDLDLTAGEQRIVEMWKDALSTLSALGMVSGPVGLEAALGQLKRLLLIGGPETGDWLSPVQVLDSKDAAGLEFDAAFLTGIDDETWPQLEPVSPLIPMRLQRQFGVSCAEPGDLRRAGLAATRALVHSAPIVAGAYHDRLAPQVRACVQKVTRLDAELWNGKRPIESFAPSELDEYRETNGPAFDVSKQARGGTRAIKAQSECPFKAFATFRLRASLPEDASFGFDALDRGKFVHTALENVWKELKSSTALHAATPAQIWELVQMAVGKTLENQDGTEFYAQTSQVERDRLQQLIYDWLMTVERERTVPFTVDSAEEPMHITLGGLPLRVRMDRVDRLEDGGLVLIDYKTGGNINKNRLVGERPAEPQLLIYAAAQERNVDGVLFGCLAPRELRYAGFTRCKLTKLRTVEVEKDWDAFILESRDTVEGLAREYLHGEAVIRPSKHACEYCDLAALCRKDEQENTAEED